MEVRLDVVRRLVEPRAQDGDGVVHRAALVERVGEVAAQRAVARGQGDGPSQHGHRAAVEAQLSQNPTEQRVGLAVLGIGLHHGVEHGQRVALGTGVDEPAGLGETLRSAQHVGPGHRELGRLERLGLAVVARRRRAHAGQQQESGAAPRSPHVAHPPASSTRASRVTANRPSTQSGPPASAAANSS